MTTRLRSLLIYILKNICGILLCLLILFIFRWVDYAWCIISVVLVLSPEGTDAPDLALTRIKANLVGVSTGFLLLLTSLPAPYHLLAGCVISLAACDLFRLNAGSRSAVVAMIIIFLHEEGTHVWDGAWQRLSAVVIGCLAGLLVTYIFHSFFGIRVHPDADKRENEREG